jgi:hypothetical protein
MDSKYQAQKASLDYYLLTLGKESLTNDQMEKLLSGMLRKRTALKVLGIVIAGALTVSGGYLIGALLGLNSLHCALALCVLRVVFSFDTKAFSYKSEAQIVEETMDSAVKLAKDMPGFKEAIKAQASIDKSKFQ